MDLKALRQTDESVILLPGARVNGDVTMGPGCSVWFNAVIRGDEAPITIGENTNIQDNATLHSCTVGDNCLIGMGSIVLDDAVIGRNCIVGAGALVTKNTVVPDGSMVLGSPAKVRRALTEEEIDGIRQNALSYVKDKELYR